MSVGALVAALALTACLFGLAFCGLMLIRNEFVHAYLKARIAEAYRANMADLALLRGLSTDAYFAEAPNVDARTEARWAWVEAMDYDTMLLRFWRPLSSFHGPMP